MPDTPRTPLVGSLSATGIGGSVDITCRPLVGSLSGTGIAGRANVDTACRPSTGSLSALGIAGILQGRLGPGAGSLGISSVRPIENIGITIFRGAIVIGLPAHYLTIKTGSLSVTGNTVGLGKRIVPNTGEAYFGTLFHEIEPSCGNITSTGYQPSLKVLQPFTGSLNITGIAGILSRGIQPSTGSLSASGVSPLLYARLNPPSASLTIAGSTAIQNIVNQPLTGSLTITGVAPVLSARLSPLTGSLVITGNVLGGIQPLTGALSATGVAGTLSRGIQASTGALNVTGAAGVLTGRLQPLTGSLNLIGMQPSGNPNTPLTGSLTISGVSPFIGLSRSPLIATGSLSFTGTSPVILRLVPQTGSLAISSVGPSCSTGILVSSGKIAVGLQAHVLTIMPGRLVLSGNTPVTSGMIVPKTGEAYFGTLFHEIEPSTGSITGTGYQIGVHPTTLMIQRGQLLTATTAPLLVQSSTVQPTIGSITITGTQPIIGRINRTPVCGTLATTGIAPVLNYGFGRLAQTGSLILNGQTATPSIFIPSTSAWKIEPLLGTVDGVNKSFSLSFNPVPETLLIVFTGVPLETVISQPDQMQFAYTVQGANIQLGIAPSPGRRPWARYYKAA